MEGSIPNSIFSKLLELSETSRARKFIALHVNINSRRYDLPSRWYIVGLTTDIRDRLHWLPVQRIESKCVSWCTSVCIRLHQHTLLNCAHRCLNQPAVVVVTSVQLHRVTRHWLYCTTLQNDEIWPKMFRCFRTNLVELTPIGIS